MTLNEMIDELRRNILRDVSDAENVDELDLLWTDAALTRYINDGYFRFCHLTEYIQDATTPEVCEIAIVPGQTVYPLHNAVIRVLSAEYDGRFLPANRVSYAQGDNTDFATRASRYVNYGTGVHGIVPDYEIGSLFIMGTPSDDDAGKVLKLRVTRYPLKELSLDEPDESPELPARFHLDLLEWAAFRALRNHDVDAENMAKASAHSTRFERAVEEVKSEYRARTFSRIGFTSSWRWY